MTTPVMENPAPLLRVEGISCYYEDEKVADEVRFAIGHGELCCLLGPSGCGKTTILRAIAGFEPVHGGKIILDGAAVSTPGNILPPEKRGIGLVFQEYALFPHMTIAENIRFAMRGQSPSQQRARLREFLELVALPDGVRRDYPHELSGGEQQRAALVRALCASPRLLLLDEPFSNLDADLRRSLNLRLRNHLKKQRMSALLVTHDQEEAFAFADSMGILHRGRLQQWDTPYNLYHIPKNRFVAKFIGQGRFIRGTLRGATVRTAIGEFEYGAAAANGARAGEVDVLIRPDDILYATDGPFSGKITDKVFAGDRILYTLHLAENDTELQSLMPSHLDFEVGAKLSLRADLEHVIIFTDA